jgi:hypothetical protein
MNDNDVASSEADLFAETVVAVGVFHGDDARDQPHPPHWVPQGVTGLLAPDHIEREWTDRAGWDSSRVNNVLYLIPADDFRRDDDLVFRRQHGLRTMGPEEFTCTPADIARLREAARQSSAGR